MLIIGRKRDQKIVIADNIVITILEIGRNRVRFGIEAPKEIPIHTKQQSLAEEDTAPSEKAATARKSLR
jgi:carbon storage regulator